MKKLCGLIAIVCMLVCIPCAVNAAIIDSGECGADGDNVTWTLDDEGTLIISGTGDMKDYSNPGDDWELPGYIDMDKVIRNVVIEDGVTSIGGDAFVNRDSLINVSIPDSVTNIGDRAFENCDGLTSVKISKNVTSIGEFSFGACTALTYIEVDENNPNYTSDNGVLFDKNKTHLIQYPAGKTDTQYSIPNSVTSIGEWSLCGCSYLTNVTIPYGVTRIDEGAFAGTDLKTIDIPESVTSIGIRAFDGTGIYNNPNNWIDGVLYIGDYLITAGSYRLTVPSSTVYYDAPEICIVKDGTRYITDTAFNGCGVTNVIIPDSVVAIGEWAFGACFDLTSVTIGNGVKSIGEGAFNYCEALTSVTIPDSVVSMGENVFGLCSNLTSVTIGSNVESISASTFRRCSNLTRVDIPKSVTSIGRSAFLGCDSLNDIYYNGSEAEWAAVNIGEYNEALTSAAIHCNGGAQTSPPISVTVNGAAVAFDQPPIIEEGRTLVPVRAIFEALGATVYWNGDTRTVTATKDNTIIILQIGNNIMQKNGENIILDVPAKIISDRTLVPVRAVAEAFDNTVGWNGDTREVIITD